MNLKNEEALAKAARKTYGDLTPGRKQQIISTVQAASPEKHVELHTIFTQGLIGPEKEFYLDIIDVTDDEAGAAQAAAAASAARPILNPATSTPPPAKVAANGSAQ